jgi:hypothetical protein
MAQYVFSFRVPSDYAPHAGTPAEWQAWFGGLGPALVDVVVSAADMDAALALAKDCPVMRVGGGVEVGPVMEAAGS